MQAVLELFLTRIATLGIVIMSSLVVEYFPIELRNASAITLFTVGIPSVLLALWAGVRPRPTQSLGRTLVRFTAPAAVVSSLAGLVVFYGALFLAGTAGDARPAAEDVAAAQSALTAFLVVSGIVLVLFAAPPNRWFAVVEPPTGDVRPIWLALALFAGFAAMLVVPAGRTLFDLAPLEPAIVALVAGVLVAWFIALRATWRHHLLERLLGVAPARA
jgi:cation-transporting ATPase E